jgi:hypothetical protein
MGLLVLFSVTLLVVFSVIEIPHHVCLFGTVCPEGAFFPFLISTVAPQQSQFIPPAEHMVRRRPFQAPQMATVCAAVVPVLGCSVFFALKCRYVSLSRYLS